MDGKGGYNKMWEIGLFVIFSVKPDAVINVMTTTDDGLQVKISIIIMMISKATARQEQMDGQKQSRARERESLYCPSFIWPWYHHSKGFVYGLYRCCLASNLERNAN